MPPLPYTLQIMWDHLFTRYAADQSEDEQASFLSFDVSAENVTKDLQEYFGFKSNGARSPEIPSITWVRKALDTLVNLKLAVRKGEGQYTVAYKRTRGDTLRKFGKLCFELEQKMRSVPPNQLPLLRTGGSSPIEPQS
jgi:hypothetical protein